MKTDKTLIALFEKSWQQSPQCYVRAPGRVNLIGEHTDYNEGFVLPCAIDFHIDVLAVPNLRDEIRVIANDFSSRKDCFSLNQPIQKQDHIVWANYVRGVVSVFQDYLQTYHNALAIKGIDLLISGNVPIGAGLSSSAALEVAIGKTLQTLFQLPIDNKTIALLAQRAENTFVGCQCGIMDQMVSALGQQDKAMLLDCRDLSMQLATIPDSLNIMIIHSNVQRGLVDSEYNLRRQQCEKAAEFLGVKTLREANIEQLMSNETSMDKIVFKRAKHVMTENKRTCKAVAALNGGDVKQLSQLMAESHASMRDDFDITVPEIDALVEIVHFVLGSQGGVRMTGGGFGGCVVALVPDNLLEAVKQAIAEHYPKQTGLVATVYVCQASQGVRVLSLA